MARWGGEQIFGIIYGRAQRYIYRNNVRKCGLFAERYKKDGMVTPRGI